MVWSLVCLLALVSAKPIQVDPETNMFVDEQGRERFFHGQNVIQKEFPWYPPYEGGFNVNTTFAEADMKLWKEWGFNAVRLSCQWPGFEPEQGQLNQTYIDTLKTIADMAAGYGIYTLLDFHQDCLSEKFCGEGLPNWATKTRNGIFATPMPFGYPFSMGPDHVPTQEQCGQHNWTLYQMTMSGAYGYQALYDNVDGIQDALGGFWGNVSKTFANDPNVLGYEIINEPSMGDFYTRPNNVISGHVDKKYLQPMYENIQKHIRAQDEDHIIFFEPVQFDSSKKQTGFTQVPGGDAYQNRSALSFHYYKPPNGNEIDHFNNRRKDTQRLRTGGMLTEYSHSAIPYNIPGGKNRGPGPDIPVVGPTTPEKIMKTADIADEHLFSWTGWEYKIFYPITGASYSVFNPDGSINHTYLATLTRTYPQAVAGRTRGFSFNNSTAEFFLNFTANEVTSNDFSVVYLHEENHYPNGYNVTFVEGDGKLFEIYQPDYNNYIYINPLEEVPVGMNVSIRISKN